MSKYLVMLVLLHLVYLMSISICATDHAYFRQDYTYLEAKKSFYKLHRVHRTWVDAKRRCVLEGATLFYPEEKAEVDAMFDLMNKERSGFSLVWIGVTDLLVKGVFETIDGRSVNDVFNVWGPGEPNDSNGSEDCVILMKKEVHLRDASCDKKYPFICKKTAASIDWNFPCNMPDKSYLYNETLGKCYKFHQTPKNWADAYSICVAEESYLAIINSQHEADLLVKITADALKDKVDRDYLRDAVYLGFHNRFDDGWMTITGTSLEDSGYSAWGNNQPDGGDKERCGAMFYNGHLSDLTCAKKSFFICEHDISSLSSAINERGPSYV